MTTAGDALTRALDQLARRPLRNAVGKAVQWAVEDGIIRPLAGPTGRIVVAPGQPISSGWGNAVWDQSVQCFLNDADRLLQFPNPQPGAVWYLLTEGVYQLYDGVGIKSLTAHQERIRIGRTAGWTLPHGAWTIPGGLAVDLLPQPNTLALNGTANGVVIGRAGGYMAGTSFAFPGNATGRRGVAVVKNGDYAQAVFNTHQDLRLAASAGLSHTYTANSLVECVPGDVISPCCFQDSTIGLGVGFISMYVVAIG